MMPFLSFLIFFALYAGAAFPAFGTDAAASLLAAAAENRAPLPAQALEWLVAKLCLWVPFSNPAYRTGLAAALLMAATVPLMARAMKGFFPAGTPSPLPDRELERQRWLGTSRWLTALLWGLSPGPWLSALALGPSTLFLFLLVLTARLAARPSPGRRWALLPGLLAAAHAVLNRADLAASPAALWGAGAVIFSLPLLWAYHRAGVRWPAARAALALLLPLCLLGQLGTAARGDTALLDRAENRFKSLPLNALLWDPAEPGGVLYIQAVDRRRTDVRVLRRPASLQGRADYWRRWGRGPLDPNVSPALFFLMAAADAGPERIFTDSAARLPAVDPATGLATGGDYPADALPVGNAYYFLPAESHRLVAPAAQLSVARLPLWAARTGDPSGLARSHMALSLKFDEFGLTDGAEEEALAALACDPSLPEAHRRLGEAALTAGKAARAVFHFQRALDAAPHSPELWSLLGRAARAAGRTDEALRAHERAVHLNPSAADDVQAAAELLEAAKRWRAAADRWRRLSDLRPEDPAHPWRLAKAEAAAGRPGKARAALREYLMFPLSDEEKAEADTFEKSLPRP